MSDFNSNFKCSYLHSSNAQVAYDSLSECLKANNTFKLSPLVASIFTRYGNRCPYPFTIFDSVYESTNALPYNLDHKSNINLGRLPFEDVTFSLENYLSALRNAIATDRKNKVVFLSSGWDSTCILALLVEKYGPKGITCITLRMAYDAKNPSTTFNPYELKKAASFCEYYKVKHIIVDSDFCNKNINHEDRLKELSNASLYNATAYNHKTLWRAVEELGFEPSDTVVYAGEFSDGAHNWGFAQSFGAVHPEIGLRQYADKARAYFMSPSFLNRVFVGDETLNNDSLSKWLLPGPIKSFPPYTSEPDFLANYLCDLYYEDVRGPYIKSSIDYLPSDIVESGRQVFLKTIVEANLPPSINQIYKAYIDIYHYTHWMGSTVHGLRHFAPDKYQLLMPFGDQTVLQLLRTMPTEFGRGLEIRPTKYPLKKILKEFVDYPYQFQKGQHAYTYDDDQSINLVEALMVSGTDFYEILYNDFLRSPHSSLTKIFPDLSEAITLYSKQPANVKSTTPTDVITAFLLINFQLNYLSA